MRFIKKRYFLVVLMLLLSFVGCDINDMYNNIEQPATATAEKTTEQVNNNGVTVHFLDVGQGNATLIEASGKYILIDGGDREHSSFVVSYLQKLGVSSIDYIIASHYDEDHIAGLVGVMQNFNVSNIIRPNYIADTNIYNSFNESSVKSNNIYPNVGEMFTVSNLTLTIVCPNNYNNSDENANSIGVKIQHENDSFLICGDATEESEKNMLASNISVESDVYECNHHGSSSATSNKFLKAVNPKYAIISCGLENSYGHPHKETVNKLSDSSTELFRTDLQGTIIAYSSGTGITWNIEPSNDYRCGKDVATNEKNNSTTSNSDTINVENTYILNTHTKKVHLPNCSSIKDINDANKKTITCSIKDLESQGYEPCKKCLNK